MSEKLLNALMELFAIIANINDLRDKGQYVVRDFLKQQLNLDAVDDYVEVFNQYFEKHSGGKKKRTPVSHSVQGLVICSQINEALTQAQKLTILIRLLEFINLEDEISEDEYDFVETVGLAFNFEESEYNKIKNYVIETDRSQLDYPEILMINNKPTPEEANYNHVLAGNLSGYISFFKVSSLDMYLVSMKTDDEIFLNGVPVQQGLIYPFVNGSTLRGQKISTLYYSDIVSSYSSELAAEKVVFEGKDISYIFPGNRVGLHHVNFCEESGKLVGIMGASGAGKTTLLNVFSGIAKPTQGDVTINGKSLYDDEDSGKGLIGLIAQDDLLFEELTVYQNLYYNTQLCLGGITDEEIDGLVIRVLKSLGLFEIKDLIVGSPLNKKISGGQRKRLNIGLELIREPKVLFVDEPTSGLSSRDSENIMDLLKELTLKGKLVIVVIHQPSSDIYKMFDKLLILDTGGFPSYYGNPVDAVSYFKQQGNFVNSDKSICGDCGNINPEQIFNIIEAKVVNEYGQFTDERKVSPKRWNEIYLNNFQVPKIEIDTNAKLKPSIIPAKLKQLQVFIKRDVLSKLSNTQYLLFTFTEAPLLAFILAYLVRYYDVDESKMTNEYVFSENSNMVAYLFMSVVVALFLGMIVSAEEIIKDQKIKKREAFLNLSKGSYFFSKVMILFGISAIQTFTYVVIGNYILEIQGMTFSYWLIFFSTSCFANMLGLNISATFNSAVTIYILIPILLIPQLMLSGAIVKFDKLNPSLSSATHVPFVGDIIASKWAFEAIAVTQFKNNKYEKMFYEQNKKISKYDFKINYIIPKLRSKIDYNEKYASTTDDSILRKVNHNFELLKNEFVKIKKAINIDFDPTILTPENFNKKNAALIRSFVYTYKKFCNRTYNTTYDKKDGELWALQKTPQQKKDFIILKETYYNEDIADLVKNANDENRLIEVNGEYIQKNNPVYMDPFITKNKLDYRAHLFAPRKTLFGFWFDTLYFNVGALWLMTLILYIFLNYGVFYMILEKIESLFTRIKEKFITS